MREKGEEEMREIMGEKNSRMRVAHHEEKKPVACPNLPERRQLKTVNYYILNNNSPKVGLPHIFYVFIRKSSLSRIFLCV